MQVDDEGGPVGVDITLVRGAAHLVHADSVPPDVREALLAWLLPQGHAVVRSLVHVYDDAEVERLCIVLHEAYERAAATHGWETQTRSRVPWPDVPEPNKITMRIAVRALLAAL